MFYMWKEWAQVIRVSREEEREEKLTSLKRRGVMLRMKMRKRKITGMHKVLLTPEKEVEDTAQRSRLFRTTCKTKD
jgi:hypothetical protein